MPGVTGDTLLKPADVAAMFRVSPKTITRWARSGKLTCIRTMGGHRRYRKSDIDELVRDEEAAVTTVGEEDTLLTPAKVAALFSLNPKTITRWARSGKLTCIRTIGGHRRFRKSDIEAFLGDLDQELMKGSEVAELFGVATRTINYWAAEGQLSSIRTPSGQMRFLKEEVVELLEAQKEAVPA